MAKKVMIIDDSAAIREVVKLTLSAEGWDVVTAIDGNDGLAKLIDEKYNIIICDVNMPNLNGIEFVTKVKNDAQYADYKYIPIIMLTTESKDDVKMQGQIAGAKAWIEKPFIPDKILSVMEKLSLP